MENDEVREINTIRHNTIQRMDNDGVYERSAHTLNTKGGCLEWRGGGGKYKKASFNSAVKVRAQFETFSSPPICSMLSGLQIRSMLYKICNRLWSFCLSPIHRSIHKLSQAFYSFRFDNR